MPFHIQKMSKILQHIHTISPLCINMIVVLLIILLNLMMLPKESKNKATIEQKKYQLIENHKYFFFHSQMIQGSFHINVRRNHFFLKVCTTSNGTEMRWMKLSMIRERNGVTGCNQCDILYTRIMYMINTVLMNEWISQTEFKTKMQ